MFNLSYEDLSTRNPIIKKMYDLHEGASTKISKTLKRLELPEANSAQSYGIYQSSLKDFEALEAEAIKFVEDQESKLWNEYTAPSDDGYLDMRFNLLAMVDHLQELDEETLRTVFEDSAEARLVMRRYGELFGGNLLKETQGLLQEVFEEHFEEELNEVQAVKSALPDLSMSFDHSLKSEVENGGISLFHAEELYSNRVNDEPIDKTTAPTDPQD